MIDLSKKTLIMGILNVTPDSFSDGGCYNQVDKAVQHALKMQHEGADIIDIGGESTRPGSTPVSLDEELSRVIPVIEKLSQVLDLPISIDTYKAEVAKEAVRAGARIINDVWGAKYDPQMPQIMSQLDLPVILMHNRPQINLGLNIDLVIKELLQSVKLVCDAGFARDKIILDPGIGFGKTLEQNLQIINSLERLVQLGYPVLLGVSRKSVIRQTLNVGPDDTLEGTAAAVSVGVMKGCRIMRVHDVLAMSRLCKMLDAIIRSEK